MCWNHLDKKYCFFLFTQIAHNVLGIRRSSPPYKALRSNAVGWNVGEIKHHKGRKPDWCFSNPEPPNRRRSVYRLLCAVWVLSDFFNFNLVPIYLINLFIKLFKEFRKYFYFNKSFITFSNQSRKFIFSSNTIFYQYLFKNDKNTSRCFIVNFKK